MNLNEVQTHALIGKYFCYKDGNCVQYLHITAAKGDTITCNCVQRGNCNDIDNKDTVFITRSWTRKVREPEKFVEVEKEAFYDALSNELMEINAESM